MSITLPQNYRPTDREPFMNPMQQEYFRQKLLKWKGELVEESNQTLQNMQEESLAQPDLADRATAETDRSLELRTRDRFRKLISKIDPGAEVDRGGHLRILRGDRRADRAEAPRSPPDRHACRSRRRSATSAWSARGATKAPTED